MLAEGAVLPPETLARRLLERHALSSLWDGTPPIPLDEEKLPTLPRRTRAAALTVIDDTGSCTSTSIVSSPRKVSALRSGSMVMA